MAGNPCVVPSAMRGAAGVTPIDTKVAGEMVIEVLPDTPAVVAVMVVEPATSAFSNPAALMVAT